MPLPYSEGKHTLCSVNAYKLYKLEQCFYYYSHPWAKPTFLRQRLKGNYRHLVDMGRQGAPNTAPCGTAVYHSITAASTLRGEFTVQCVSPRQGFSNWKGMRG